MFSPYSSPNAPPGGKRVGGAGVGLTQTPALMTEVIDLSTCTRT